MTQAAATTSITGAGLTVGAVTMSNSDSVASGDVISENPAAGASVASGSAVALTVSSGPAQVAVPNVVGDTQAAATTAITGAGLKVGNVTMTSSNSVPSGSVISENPAAGTKVAPASAVDLTVSSGPPPAKHFAYAANGSDATLSAFSLDGSTGALTALPSSPVAVTGATSLSEIKIDPSGKFVYVVSEGTDQVYGFSINANDGSLTTIAGSPFDTGIKPQSLAFDATGAFLYVLDVTGNTKHSTISGYSVNASTGVLTSLGTAIISGGEDNPAQIVRAGNFLYVAIMNSSVVDVFTINADGSLTESTDPNAPYPTDTGPYGLAVDPTGTVLYTANNGSGSGSISSFRINADGSLTSFCAPNPCALPIPVKSDIGIDPKGKYLFVTEEGAGSKGQIDVYPIDASVGSLTGLGPAVPNSPFATGGSNPNSVSFDASGQWVFSGHDSTANIAEFSLNSATGALTPVAGSPVAAGNFPDFIAID
jgi:6-phosphogluconolactonase (cycloisomerase 2 family)